MIEERKRLFIFLMGLSLLAMIVLFFFAWWLVSQQNQFLNNLILTIALVFFLFLFLIITLGVFSLVICLWSFKSFKGLNIIIRKAIDVLFPVALKVGQLFGLDREKIKRSYIQVSNQLVELEKKKISPEKILLLAPHCLQKVECPRKITIDVNNCKCCGACQIGDLLMLSREKGVDLVVATGGTFARKFIKEKRPEALVAIACERDLTSGLQDVSRIPVIGVVNERPQGPCYNTRVSICKVERALNYFMLGGDG